MKFTECNKNKTLFYFVLSSASDFNYVEGKATLGKVQIKTSFNLDFPLVCTTFK